MSPPLLVLPRDLLVDAKTYESIPGPSELDFVAHLGALLPSARWLDSGLGRTAFYEIGGRDGDREVGGEGGRERVLFIQ